MPVPPSITSSLACSLFFRYRCDRCRLDRAFPHLGQRHAERALRSPMSPASPPRHSAGAFRHQVSTLSPCSSWSSTWRAFLYAWAVPSGDRVGGYTEALVFTGVLAAALCTSGASARWTGEEKDRRGDAVTGDTGNDPRKRKPQHQAIWTG